VNSTAWTILPIPQGSRPVYVSSSRGNDTADGATPGNPVRSLARAHDLLRDGSGDQMLLQRGDVWDATAGLGWPAWRKSGASASEPLVIGTFGDGPRPHLASGLWSAMTFNGNAAPIRFVAIMGITAAPVGYNGLNSDCAGIDATNGCEDFFIEDCRFEGYFHGISVQWAGGSLQPKRWKVRRSVVLDCYHQTAHAQGVWGGSVDGFTLEECILDHNGWKAGVAEPTMYNHNTYFDAGCRNVVLDRCISTRASQNGLHFRGGGVMTGCLLVDNPVNIAVGGNGADVTLRGNTVLGSARVGQGIDVADARDLLVEDNLIAHARGTGLSNCRGLLYQGFPYQSLYSVGNVVHDWADASAPPSHSVAFIDNSPAGTRKRIADLIDRPASAYPDASRDIEGYMRSVLCPIPTRDAFFTQIRAQCRDNWRPQLEAAAVNAWIRAGFNMGAPAT
jgi:hypothetical protein